MQSFLVLLKVVYTVTTALKTINSSLSTVKNTHLTSVNISSAQQESEIGGWVGEWLDEWPSVRICYNKDLLCPK